MAEENKADETPETEATEAAPAKKAPPTLTPEQKAKRALKSQIKALKKGRDEGRSEWDRKQLTKTRRGIHRLRRKLKRAVRAAG